MKRAILALLIALSFLSYGFSESMVKKIMIIGNERVGKDAIMEVIKTKVGKPLDRDTIREDIKRIYGMGYFKDVQVDVIDRKGGKEVVFIVVEKPTVGSVMFRGVTRIPIKDIREKIKTREGDIFSEKKLKEDIDAIRQLYLSRGYYGTTVRAKVKEMPGNRVRVVFIVKEKKKLFVKKVRIEGCKKIKEKALKKRLATKKRTIFSFFTGTGVLDEERIRADIAIIKSYYMNHGFIDVKVKGPIIKLTKDKKGLVVIYRVKEGDQYRCGEIDIYGDLIVPKWLIMEHLSQKKGDIFRWNRVKRDIEYITDLYADRGYAFVDVNPHMIPNRAKKLVNLAYEVKKNQLVWIRRINISGNLKTRDRVIRREVRVSEGDLYSATALKRTKQRLQNTGYFDQVEVKTKRVSENAMDVDIRVKDGRTGSILLGAGFSTTENFIITGTIQEKNLFGMGYSIYWSGQIGGVSQHYTFSFFNPRYKDTDTSVGFSLYNEIYEYDSFNSRQKGLSFTLGKYVGEFSSILATYRFENSKVYDVDESASRYVKESAGRYSTSSLYLKFTKDTRDNAKEPRSGYLYTHTLELAAFGGNTRYFRNILDFSKFFKGPKSTRFSIRSRIGIIKGLLGDSVPIYEKFYVGGPSTIRGFDTGEAGPLDENRDPIGARYEFVNNFEWHFPLISELGLNGMLFMDVGRGSNSLSKALTDLRITTGFGLSWTSPMGPITITFSLNPFKRKGEDFFSTDFSFGGK